MSTQGVSKKSLGMRIGATLAIVVALAAACALTAIPASSATGFVRDDDVSLSNSRQGSAVLTARDLRPGGSSTGTIKIANNGDVAVVSRLTHSNLQEAVGPNGGSLSGKLDLRIEDMARPESPLTVYSGKVRDMGTVALGTFEPDESHTYRLTLSFPEGGSSDSLYQGSSMSIQFDWTVVQS